MNNTDLMTHEVVDKETFYKYYKQRMGYEKVDMQELQELAHKLNVTSSDWNEWNKIELEEELPF